MGIKILIFVLFFASANSSGSHYWNHSPSQNEIETDFSTIGSSEKRTFSENDKTFTIIFKMIAELAEIRLRIGNGYDLDLPDPEIINKKLVHEFSKSLSATIHAVQIIQADPVADRTPWYSVRDLLKEVIVNTTSAIWLATNSCTTLTQIEAIEKRVSTGAIEMSESYYNSMTVGRSEEIAVMYVIKGGQEKARYEFGVVFRATFAAIKILHKISSSDVEVDSEQVLYSIDYLWKLALDCLRSEAGSSYDLLYYIYTVDLVDGPKIGVYQLSALQSKEAKQIEDWDDLTEIIWMTLDEIDVTKNVSLTIQTAKKMLLASLTDIFDINKSVLKIIRIDNSYKFKINRRINRWLNNIAESIVNALEKTQHPESAENLDAIDDNEEKVNFAVSSIISAVFDVATKISITQTHTAIETVRELVTSHFSSGFRTIFDEFRLKISIKSTDTVSKKTSLYVGVDDSCVAYSYLKKGTHLKFRLFRKLYVLNSLNNYGFDLKYNLLDTLSDEEQVIPQVWLP